MELILNKENKTVSITREFAANHDLVWEAWTNPEILDQWWAPKPILSKTKEMNFTVGGRRLYAMVGVDGKEGWSVQEYTFIDPKDSFKFLSTFSDSEGTPNSAFGPSEWDVNFTENNETTTVNIIISRDSYEELEKILEMGFREGFASALENLENYFKSINK